MPVSLSMKKVRDARASPDARAAIAVVAGDSHRRCGQRLPHSAPLAPTGRFLERSGPDDLFLGGSLHYHPQFTPCEVAQLEPSVHGLLIVLPAVYLLERRLSRPLFERSVPSWINVEKTSSVRTAPEWVLRFGLRTLTESCPKTQEG
jgi:hypothetical protein